MTGRLRSPTADPRRKVRFREAARDIVAKDRYDRRAGLAVDTAGAIARALERAYRQGFEDAQSQTPAAAEPVDAEAALEWALIPPRPRAAFWSISLFCLGRGENSNSGGHLVEAMTPRGTAGWRLIASDGRDIDVIGGNTIKPLVRLGLVAPTMGVPSRLLVTERGRLTWKRFLDLGGQYPEDLTRI